jgi:hypothetical protein
MDPELASTIQFTAFFMLAVVPEIESGSHTYVLRMRLEDTHLWYDCKLMIFMEREESG